MKRWTGVVCAAVLLAFGPLALAAGDPGAPPPLIPKPGVAQLVTALTTILIFCLLLAVLGKFAWGPIVSGLRAREAKIRKEIADAEEARAKAEATLKEYSARLATAEEQVREMINKAVAQGEAAATDLRMRAQTEAEESKSRAVRDIEEARKQALGDIYAQAAEISTRIAEKIIRRELRPEDQQELVRRSLDELQTVGR